MVVENTVVWECVVIVAIIVACEIGFWVVLAAGLTARYGLRWRRVSSVLLMCVPLVDLVLLSATVLDLRNGAEASAAHGLAAAYLGFSVAFGHQTISALDARIAHRFAGAPAPERAPRHGPALVRREWRQWRQALLAWSIACALLTAAVAFVNDGSRTAELRSWLWGLTAALIVWLVAGPLFAHARVNIPR